MARLEHVNLVVHDVDATLRFILTAFPDWRVRGSGTGEWYGHPRKWLHVGTDDYYITLNSGTDAPVRDLTGNDPGLAHIGFEVDDCDALKERLVSGGYEVATLGGDHPFRKTVYFIDPAGLEFEFIQYLSEIPAEKNLYGGETSPAQRFA